MQTSIETIEDKKRKEGKKKNLERGEKKETCTEGVWLGFDDKTYKFGGDNITTERKRVRAIKGKKLCSNVRKDNKYGGGDLMKCPVRPDERVKL